MSVKKSMAVLSMIGLVDAISYMAVSPSLIFYVTQAGGSKEFYGMVMSAFSFASFCAKPVYGIWVDKGGHKYRVPYLATFSMSVVGALLYFLASAVEAQNLALGLILAGRLLSGMGGANGALGFAYIASVVPQDQQTRVNTVLAMTRILGMAAGPGVNLLLDKIDYSWTIGGYTFDLDPLNSVGLVLAGGNLFVMLVVFFLFEEPPEKKSKLPADAGAAGGSRGTVLEAVMKIEIILPIIIILVVNSCFQFVETGLPVAAKDGLGWGPVETSAVLGGSSVVIFGSMVLTMVLSGKVHDLLMVAIGNCAWVVGGFGMWYFWVRDGAVWEYVVPVAVACMGFPFIAAANRTTFTKAVSNTPQLEDSEALMQSILSMSASVAGFVTPGFVAAYALRTPEEVSASSDMRETTPVGLYVAILPLLATIGVLYQYGRERRAAKAAEADAKGIDETTPLKARMSKGDRRKSSVAQIGQAFSRRSEVARRESAQLMGIVAFDTKAETELREQMLEDMEEWAKLGELDFGADDESPPLN